MDISLPYSPEREFSHGVPQGANVIMFSGGRDSTLAALRSDRAEPAVLVTIAAPHLTGVGLVRQRVEELSKILPGGTIWKLVRQPTELATDTSFYEQTCLPCHHAYVVVGSALAVAVKAKTLTFGYAGYQRTWPEQTPTAIASLRRVLARHGIVLQLPVQDLESRQAAIDALEQWGVNGRSLEQKCMLQVNNIELDAERLASQVSLWEGAIEKSLGSLDRISIDTLDTALLGDIRARLGSD